MVSPFLRSQREVSFLLDDDMFPSGLLFAHANQIELVLQGGYPDSLSELSSQLCSLCTIQKKVSYSSISNAQPFMNTSSQIQFKQENLFHGFI